MEKKKRKGEVLRPNGDSKALKGQMFVGKDNNRTSQIQGMYNYTDTGRSKFSSQNQLIQFLFKICYEQTLRLETPQCHRGN